jgi:hypothetical protein
VEQVVDRAEKVVERDPLTWSPRPTTAPRPRRVGSRRCEGAARRQDDGRAHRDDADAGCARRLGGGLNPAELGEETVSRCSTTR